nr:MAG TPA: hypothetical protein [Caudoviricetes sp.]
MSKIKRKDQNFFIVSPFPLLITGGSFTKRIQPRYSDFQGCTF